MAEVLPATPGYEITRFEVRAFCAALGLPPGEVLSLLVEGNRVVAELNNPRRTIVVHVVNSRQ